MNRAVLTEAFNEKFGTDKNQFALASLMTRSGIKSGRTGCFPPGLKPWNTGTRGIMKRNSGTFKKGNVPGNTKPVGTERIPSRVGDSVLVKIEERNPYTGAETRYKHKQVVLWEAENGPVPKGKVVFFKDSDNTNFELDNLVLISRAELLVLNQSRYKDLSYEVKPAALSNVKLKCETWSKEKKENNGNL